MSNTTPLPSDVGEETGVPPGTTDQIDGPLENAIARTPSPHPTHYIADNCLYLLSYLINQSTTKTATEHINSLYSYEECQVTFAKCRDIIPSDIHRSRNTAAATKTKILEILSRWLGTTSPELLPHIFADDPYKLPSPASKDLTLFNVVRDATSSRKEVRALRNELQPTLDSLSAQLSDLTRQVSEMTGYITTLNSVVLHEAIEKKIDDFGHRLNQMTEAVLNTGVAKENSHPIPFLTSPSLNPPSDVPPSPLASVGVGADGVQNITPQAVNNIEATLPTSPALEDGRSESDITPSPPQSPPNLETSCTSADDVTSTEGDWQSAHSNTERRKVRRKRNKLNKLRRQAVSPPGSVSAPLPSSRPPSSSSSISPHHRNTPLDRPQRPKRCHVVIHNLHGNTTLEEVNLHIRRLTGADPILSHPLLCRNRNKAAFRITCLFSHLHLLTAENFGPRIIVSRYFLSRDLGRLTPPTTDPSPAESHSSGGTQTSDRAHPRHDSLRRHPTPSEDQVSEFISNHRS